jgi:hypothetical protein
MFAPGVVVLIVTVIGLAEVKLLPPGLNTGSAANGME